MMWCYDPWYNLETLTWIYLSSSVEQILSQPPTLLGSKGHACYAHRSSQTCNISSFAPGSLRDSSLFLVAIQSFHVLTRLNMRVVLISVLLVLSLAQSQVTTLTTLNPPLSISELFRTISAVDEGRLSGSDRPVSVSFPHSQSSHRLRLRLPRWLRDCLLLHLRARLHQQVNSLQT